MKLRYFNYMRTDCKAMEEHLNRMAQKGLALQWLKYGFAGFAPTQRTDLCYTVEPAPKTSPSEEEERADWEYRLLCADAGWEVAAQNRTFRVFASKEGAHPLPMDTDPALAYQEKWDRPLLWDGLGSIALGLVWLFCLLPQNYAPGEWYSLLYLAVMLFAGCWSIFDGGRELWVRRKFRLAAENGESLPTLSSRFALLWYLVRDLILLSMLLLLVLLLFRGPK